MDIIFFLSVSFNACANRAYYAIFQVAIAALANVGITPETEVINHGWVHGWEIIQYASERSVEMLIDTGQQVMIAPYDNATDTAELAVRTMRPELAVKNCNLLAVFYTSSILNVRICLPRRWFCGVSLIRET